MNGNAGFVLRQAQSVLQIVALYLVVGLTITLIAALLLGFVGVMPWPELGFSWGGVAVDGAGKYAMIGLTLLFCLLCFFLPANARMARLEGSHRSFQISMEDVKRAYALAHLADRKGVFSLSSEFENMRQRMELLRKHPDLSHLEPELMELASQMSFESRDLARAYSEDKVNRAKGFLQNRQEEVELMQDRIKLATYTTNELRRWLQDVEVEERKNHEQIRRLEADLREVLPALGYDFEEVREPNVVALPKPAPKEGGLH